MAKMAKVKVLLLIVCLGLSYVKTVLADSYYKFQTTEQAQTFQKICQDLRCLVCQNQNIMESNSLFAEQMKEDIAEKIQAGQSKNFILADIERRFGSQILIEPPLNKQNFLLWLSPFLIFFCFVLGFSSFVCVKKFRNRLES